MYKYTKINIILAHIMNTPLLTPFASSSQRAALLQSLYLSSGKNGLHPSTYIVDASVESVNSMSLSVG